MISVEELIEALKEAANDGNVVLNYDGAVLYAESVEVKDGDVIIFSEP
jgi:biopolymer transport protein ExbD